MLQSRQQIRCRAFDNGIHSSIVGHAKLRSVEESIFIPSSLLLILQLGEGDGGIFDFCGTDCSCAVGCLPSRTAARPDHEVWRKACSYLICRNFWDLDSGIAALDSAKQQMRSTSVFDGVHGCWKQDFFLQHLV
jgi:hypothetical protein